MIAVAVSVGVFGAEVLAANQIVLNVIAVGFAPALAVGGASAVRVTQGAGYGSCMAVRRSASMGPLIGVIVMVFMAGLLRVFPERILSLFLDLNDPANT